MSKKRLITTIPATEVRVHFGDALKRVHGGEEQVIIEKGGLRVAALLSYADFEQYQKLLALYQLEQLNRDTNQAMRAKGMTEEQALADFGSIKKEVFKDYYGHDVTETQEHSNAENYG